MIGYLEKFLEISLMPNDRKEPRVQIGYKVSNGTKKKIDEAVLKARAAGMSADQYFTKLINQENEAIEVKLYLEPTEYKELEREATDRGLTIEDYIYDLLDVK